MNPGPRRDHHRVALSAAAALAMVTGIILFTQFHVGHGSHAGEFGGIPKWYWVNVHRTAAVFFTFFAVHHLHTHWRAITRLFTRLPRLRGQTCFCILLLLVSVTGFVAWMALPHGTRGIHGVRHTVIDVHNIAGLLLFVGTALHLRRRWRFLWPRTQTQQDSTQSSG